MKAELHRFIKALLFASAEPLTVKDMQEVWMRWQQESVSESNGLSGAELEATAPFSLEALATDNSAEATSALLPTGRIREALEALADELENSSEIYRLVNGPRGSQLTTAPDCAQWVRLLRKEPRPARLSPSAMETLAVIAYRQPTTRAEMEFIRGVSVDNTLNKLLERELIAVTGRSDLPGRPLHYGTTDKFLEFIGVSSLEELPIPDILRADQVNAWIHDALAAKKESAHSLEDEDAEIEKPALPEPVPSA